MKKEYVNKWKKGVSVDETVEAMSVSSFFETFMKKRTKKSYIVYSWDKFFLAYIDAGIL